MNGIRYQLLSGMILCLAALALEAATITVAKNGSAMYTTIQAAVDKAGPGDIVQVLDDADYPEQVTIDSTKNGLTLTSKFPAPPNKPKIIWQDKDNVGPKTAAEAKIETSITYDRNGALRVLGARGVTIDGIAIDGGGVYPFGYNQIWESAGQSWPLQHGNAALALWVAGGTIVKNCDISNAYFGISVNDRNDGGIFAIANPGDMGPWNPVPNYAFGRAGNHLIEYNRIHDNSFGFFFENMWDLGSTIRYNLIYENHHPTDALAAQVKSLTSDGMNHTGGAMLFKAHLLSPLAVYNNTFRHNFLLFAGNWRAGVQHLVFNNIFAKPHRYWSNDPNFPSPFHEMSPKFANRMHHCAYAAQSAAPSESYVNIMNGMQVTGTGPFQQGVPVGSPFPASADIRWVETKFLSEDPASADFLVPDWNDTIVQKYIKDKGWPESGIKDPDGSLADLGAIPSGSGRPADIVTIKPITPVMIFDTVALLNFDIIQQTGTIKNPVINYFRYIRDIKYQANIFGGNATPIPAADIVTLPVPSTPVIVGPNCVSATIPAPGAAMLYALFEFTIEGTGSDGKPVTTSAGFMPYNKMNLFIRVEILNKNKVKTDTVSAGDTAILRLSAFKSDNTPFTDNIQVVKWTLGSGRALYVPGTQPPAPLENPIPGGLTITKDIAVLFSGAPAGRGFETVSVNGFLTSGTQKVPYGCMPSSIVVRPQGGSGIVPGPAAPPAFGNNEVTITWFDLRGKVLHRQTAGSAAASFTTRDFAYLWKTKHAASVRLVRVEIRDVTSGKTERRLFKTAAF